MPTALGVIASAFVPPVGGPCTDVLMEPFDLLSNWTNVTNLTFAAGRNGTGVKTDASNSRADYTIPVPQQSDTVTVGFAFQANGFSSDRPLFELCGDAGATTHIYALAGQLGGVIVYRGTVAQFLGQTATGLLVAGNWYYLEFQVKLHDTAGSVIVRINGVERLNLTNVDTKNGGSINLFDTFRLKGAIGFIEYFDDLYITTGSCPFKGDITVPSQSGPCAALLESFDDLTAWTVTGAPSIVAGRTGNGASLNASAIIDYPIPVPSRSDYITIGFAWRINSAAAGQRFVLRLYSDTTVTEHFRLMHDSTGCLVALHGSGAPEYGRSAPASIAINTWYYIEVQARCHDTLGSITVRLNGVTVITATDVDTNLNSPYYGAVRLANSISGVTSIYDDLYLSLGPDCPFRGDIAIPASGPDVLLEPFNNLASWTSVSNTTVVAGRNGNGAQVSGVSGGGRFTIPSIWQNGTITFGFAVRINSLTNQQDLIGLYTNGGSQTTAKVTVNSSGSIQGTDAALSVPSGGGSVAGTIVAGTWYYVEVQYVLHDTAGSYVIRVNGTQVAAKSGIDTKASTGLVYDQIRLIAPNATFGGTVTFDDMYVTMGAAAFKGDIIVP